MTSASACRHRIAQGFTSAVAGGGYGGEETLPWQRELPSPRGGGRPSLLARAGSAEARTENGVFQYTNLRCHGPIDFLFIDCNFGNYYPCFVGIEGKLAEGGVVVGDNAGIGAGGMADYLRHVRSRFDSGTEWFDTDLPWEKRDAMEVTVIRRPKKEGPAPR